MKIVVHLTKSEGEQAIHSALMALGMATALCGMGAEVTVMLDSEAPNLAKKSWASKTLTPRPGTAVPMGKRPMAPRRLGEQFNAFFKAGGKVLMCPHCSAACGASVDVIVPGATLAAEGGLAILVFEADKVVDY